MYDSMLASCAASVLQCALMMYRNECLESPFLYNFNWEEHQEYFQDPAGFISRLKMFQLKSS